MGKSYSSQKVIRIIKAKGWYEVRQKGTDHKQFKHPTKPGKVTVPHPVKDLDIEVLKSIEKQAGVKFK
ncbi:MAG: addiction module toxin, HicA family [Firmicutes bacterium HGW-Firmicutes-8]|nr:MAG: addiction module toxin, HicA family [Firmicutes bacterium HGW-Firmicutes-8]